MSSTALPGSHPVPPHVPANLVFPFDFFSDPRYRHDPFSVVREAHDRLPRIFFTPTHYQKPGSWVVTQAEDIRWIWQDAALFSSVGNVGFNEIVRESWILNPVELDPPAHGRIRSLLNPFFSPNRLKALDGDIRETASSLISQFEKEGGCEFVSQFAYPFPVSIFLRMMGLPTEDLVQFVTWVKGTTTSTSINLIRSSVRSIADYMRVEIARRKKAPTGDLMSEVVHFKVDGVPLTDDEIMGICYLLFLGGLDTVTASLGFHFQHLATHVDVQRQLRDDRTGVPGAVEELLRLYPIVQVQRQATRDLEFAGVQIKKGDWITLSPGMAHSDEKEFERPSEFDPKRVNQRHMTFAVGPHRCLGSHLARRELVTAYNEWFDRVPPFTRVGESLTSGGPVFNVSKLELTWGD